MSWETNSDTGNERFPAELGWTKKADVITLAKVVGITGLMQNAVDRIEGGSATNSKRRRGGRDMHGGLF